MKTLFRLAALGLVLSQTSCFYSTVSGYEVPFGAPAYVVPPRPPVVMAPAPVVVAPSPVYLEPGPVYVDPGYAPTVYSHGYGSPPVYVRPSFGMSFGWSDGCW